MRSSRTTEVRNLVLLILCGPLCLSCLGQEPSVRTHRAVAKTYYAQVKMIADAERTGAGNRDEASSRQVTGIVVDQQGHGIPAARVQIQGDASMTALSETATDVKGSFQLNLAPPLPGHFTLTVTKQGYARWSRGGIRVGVDDTRVRLDRELDQRFFHRLVDEQDPERRLWMLLEVVGNRQFPAKPADVFMNLGQLRSDLVRLARSDVFDAQDDSHTSPAERARMLLAYWHDEADEQVFGPWLKKQKQITHPIAERMVGASVEEVGQQWVDRHFGQVPAEERTFHALSVPKLDPGGRHALVEFVVEYNVWGYSQILVLTKPRGQWELQLVAEGEHWDK